MFKIALDAEHGRNTAGKRCMKSIDPNETHIFRSGSMVGNVPPKIKF